MAVSMGSPTGGAGMYIASGSPTIINCIFTGNAASQAGGGMYNIAGSPTLIDCKFENNYAEFGAGMYNFTTMYLPQRSKPTLINCSFNGNYSDRKGGGMYNFKSDPNLINCTFNHNFALVYGETYLICFAKWEGVLYDRVVLLTYGIKGVVNGRIL